MSKVAWQKTVSPFSARAIERARWYRGTITDLSLALSFKEGKIRFEDMKDILEEEIEWVLS